MAISHQVEARARQVAFEANTALPAAYQAEIFEECLRVNEAHAGRMGAGRSVLLVGGGGYIGLVVAEHLLEQGYSVIIADCFLYGHETAAWHLAGHPHCRVVRIDFTDPNAVEGLIAVATDVVILGGLVGDPITKKYPEEAGFINETGIRQLVDRLAGEAMNKMIFVSTCSNYGLIEGDDVADEDFRLSPLSLYAKAKVNIERHILQEAARMVVSPTILRFATAFGLAPRMRFDLTVNEFVRELALGRELSVYDAHTWRPYCHVRDFARAIRHVLEAPVAKVRGEVFNAGGEVNNYTKKMIVDAITRRLPDADVAYKDHGSDPRNYRVSFRKIREALHFEPAVSVEDGIDEILAAVGDGLFSDIRKAGSFHGNYAIQYVLPQTDIPSLAVI